MNFEQLREVWSIHLLEFIKTSICEEIEASLIQTQKTL